MPENDTRHIQSGDIAEAFGLLTRLPVHSLGARGAKAGWAWPLAGAFVALIAGLAGFVAFEIGLPAGFAAAISLAVMIILTGAMHEDGLADCADGFWGGWTPERRLEIMKDSRIGAYGVIALILSLLMRWSLLVVLMQAGAPVGPLVAAAALSRAPMLAVMWFVPGASRGGLSERTGRPGGETVLLAGTVAMLVALIIVGFAALPAALGVAAVAMAISGLAKAKIGGQTGDVLGAVQQLSEIAALAIFAAILT